MVQSAPSVTLHMPEATSALRSVHTRPRNFDIMLPLPGASFELAVTLLASGLSPTLAFSWVLDCLAMFDCSYAREFERIQYNKLLPQLDG